MHLAVNGTLPRYQDLRSLWMSENGEYLAPRALSGDAFSIGKANLTRAGVAYLGVAGLENRAARTFEHRFQIGSESSPDTRSIWQRKRPGQLAGKLRPLQACRCSLPDLLRFS